MSHNVEESGLSLNTCKQDEQSIQRSILSLPYNPQRGCHMCDENFLSFLFVVSELIVIFVLTK